MSKPFDSYRQRVGKKGPLGLRRSKKTLGPIGLIKYCNFLPDGATVVGALVVGAGVVGALVVGAGVVGPIITKF